MKKVLNALEIFVNEVDNKNTEYILNTNTGVLHTAPCAKGETGNTPVEAGHRKYYNNYETAINDDLYKKDHEECLG